MQVVLLAGGLGSRLRNGGVPVGPKVLQPVGDTVFLDLLLAAYRAQGVDCVHLCLGLGADEVLDHLADCRLDQPRITSSVDRTEGGGTAHALRDALPQLEELFVVALGDMYPPPQLRARVPSAPAMWVTEECFDVRPNARTEHGQVVRYDKNGFGEANRIDAGFYLLAKEHLQAPEFSGTSLEGAWTTLAAAGRLAAIETDHPTYDIGTPERLQRFHQMLSHHRVTSAP